jgi:hypothetical protein
MNSVTPLFKLTVDSNCHHGYVYQKGINADPLDWNEDEYKAGGFHLTDLEHLAYWCDYEATSMYWVWEARIIEGTPWKEYSNKYKAHDVELRNPRPIHELKCWDDEAFCRTAVQVNPRTIRFMCNPSEVVQLEAVRRDPIVIWHIKNPSERVQLEAVTRNGCAFGCIQKPFPSVLVAARKEYADSHLSTLSLSLRYPSDIVFGSW